MTENTVSENGGNPQGKDDARKPKTRANRDSMARSDARRFSAAWRSSGENPHLLCDQPDLDDARRLVHYGGGEIRLFGDELRYADKSGAWASGAEVRLGLGFKSWVASGVQSSGERALEDLREMQDRLGDKARAAWDMGDVERGEALAAEESQVAEYRGGFRLSQRLSANHARLVGETLQNMARAFGVGEVRAAGEHNYVRRPLIALESGGAWDVAKGKAIGRDEYRDCYARSSGWALPDPELGLWANPESGDMAEAKTLMEARYPEPLLARLAMDLLGPSKRMNVVRAGLSSYGKTALFDCLANAFPGMVSKAKKSELEGAGGRFTPLYDSLSSSLWVYVDEADKLKSVLGSGDLLELTDVNLRVERKGFDPFSAVRLGTLWLLGGDWPRVNTLAQGVQTRIGWAWDYELDPWGNPQTVDPMGGREGYLMRENPAARLLRSRLLELARDIAQGKSGTHGYTKNLDPERPLINAEAATGEGNALQAFMDSGMPPAHKVFADSFKAGSGRVQSSAIQQAFADAGLSAKEIPQGSALGGLIRSFAPKAARKKAWNPEKKGNDWFWEGLDFIGLDPREREETEANDG